MKLGIDAMGGDNAPKAIIKGALLALNELPSNDTIVLFGDNMSIMKEICQEGSDSDRIQIVSTSDEILMGEKGTKSFLQKPDSSIAVGLKYLAEKKIDAFSGAGNTGAMLVGAIYSLSTIEGIIRPCTTAVIPQESGNNTTLLDVGTCPDSKPEWLYQFAIIGSIYSNCMFGIDNPRVGLLNIGEEEEKGNILTKATYKLMKAGKDFNFIGNIESRDLYKDKADVIVCDGFIGNLLLKQLESTYRLIVKRGWSDQFINSMNYEIYGGTPILGVNGTVVVGHGISSDIAAKNMILLSKNLIETGLTEKFKKNFNLPQADYLL